MGKKERNWKIKFPDSTKYAVAGMGIKLGL
jgi:hypothetical protein